MNALSEFLSMNGDGVFVWPCYAASLLILVGNIIISCRRFLTLKRTALQRVNVHTSGDVGESL